MNNGKIIAVLNDIKAKILESPYILTDHRFNVRVEALNYAIYCVETVEPKRGKWILGDSGKFKGVVSTCSVCGKKYLLGNIDYNYCPNCGAMMEESDETY